MYKHKQFSDKLQFESSKAKVIAYHTFFFWFRFLAYTYQLFDGLVFIQLEMSRAYFLISKFLYQFNLFLLYLLISSSISGNIFKYYFAIGLMFHNAIVAVIIPSTLGLSILYKYWVGLTLVSGIYFLEGILSVYISYLRKHETSMDLFKKIGANPKVNNAFATRRILQCFGEINVFLATITLYAFSNEPISKSIFLFALNIAYSFIAYLQQLTISAKGDKEDYKQRKVAIILSYVKIFAALVMLVSDSLTSLLTKRNGAYVFYTLLWFDIITISIVMHFFLVRDRNQFGSGLKEYLEFRSTRIEVRNKDMNESTEL